MLQQQVFWILAMICFWLWIGKRWISSPSSIFLLPSTQLIIPPFLASGFGIKRRCTTMDYIYWLTNNNRLGLGIQRPNRLITRSVSSRALCWPCPLYHVHYASQQNHTGSWCQTPLVCKRQPDLRFHEHAKQQQVTVYQTLNNGYKITS